MIVYIYILKDTRIHLLMINVITGNIITCILDYSNYKSVVI